jgi:hypothetical protein
LELRFVFRLALALHTSPREILAMDSAEWLGWLAYASLEPFGPAREDLRAAEVVCAVAASVGVRQKPADVFASLREPRSRERERGFGMTMAALARMCPALTPIEAR